MRNIVTYIVLGDLGDSFEVIPYMTLRILPSD